VLIFTSIILNKKRCVSVTKRVRIFFLSAALLLAIPIASVSAASKECDNDPSTSGCSQYLTPSSGSHWAYQTGSGRNGDYRINSTSYSSEELTWAVSLPSGTGSISVQAYLANASFTNRSASYYYMPSGHSTNYTLNSSFDQYNATNGFNYIGSMGGGNVLYYITVSAGGTTGANTGADAILLSW